MNIDGKHHASLPSPPTHMRWGRQRSDPELLRVATEYGKCWNPIHWHRLTQGYYDGFDDARTEYRRPHDEDLAATKERYRAEIEELKANWIPPDEAEEAIQKIYALRKERDELLESMDLLRKIGFPASRQKKLSEKFMGCAKRVMNSSIAWTCFCWNRGRRRNRYFPRSMPGGGGWMGPKKHAYESFADQALRHTQRVSC